jgi:hypothetical protein
MTDRENGPPEKERPSGYQAARPDQELADHTTNTRQLTDRRPRVCGATPLGRRRFAADRCQPIGDTGVRDPWRPWRPERLSDVQVQGAADAARHLLANDLLPVFDNNTLRALWRAGHSELVEQVPAS